MALRIVPITPGAGDGVSFDGPNQVVKVAYGAEGVENLLAEKPATESKQTDANTKLDSVIEVLGNLLTELGQKTEPANTQAVSVANAAATAASLTGLETGIPIRHVPTSVRRCSFANVGSGLLTSDLTQIGGTGTGITVSQSSGNLVIAAGTTANAEFLARSTFSVRGAHAMRFGTLLSQRIAQNNFHVMLADLIGTGLSCAINSATSVTVTFTAGQNPFTAQNVGQFLFIGAINGAAGVPGRYAIASVSGDTVTFTVAGWPASGSCTVCLFGWNYHQVLFDGTTATNAKYDAQRKGWASGDTTATINTSASPGTIIHLQSDGGDASMADSLRASNTGYQFTTRATRIENLPDLDQELYLFIWCRNGSSNPASGTTWTINFVGVEDLENVKVYLAGATKNGAGNAMAVNLQGTNAVNISANQSITPIANTGQGSSTALRRLLTGDTNAVNIKNGAGVIGHLSVYNDSATKFYLKLYNKASAPTLASDTPEMTIPVPAGANVQVDCGPFGLRYGTGISIAVVRGIGDTDTSAVTANDGVVCMRYT